MAKKEQAVDSAPRTALIAQQSDNRFCVWRQRLHIVARQSISLAQPQSLDIEDHVVHPSSPGLLLHCGRHLSRERHDPPCGSSLGKGIRYPVMAPFRLVVEHHMGLPDRGHGPRSAIFGVPDNYRDLVAWFEVVHVGIP